MNAAMKILLILLFQTTTSLPSWPAILQVDQKCNRTSNVNTDKEC